MTPEVFERVQEVFRIHDRAGERQRRHPHYLRGTLHCGSCGRRLSSMVAKGRFPYFFCTAHTRREGCGELYVPGAVVEGEVAKVYRGLRLRAELREALDAALRNEVEARYRHREWSFTFWTRRLATLDAERAKVLRAYYADALPLALLQREQARINEAVAHATGELAVAQAERDEVDEVLAVARESADTLEHAYRRSSPETRRRFNQAFFAAIFVKDRRVVQVEYREPFGRGATDAAQPGEARDEAAGYRSVTP